MSVSEKVRAGAAFLDEINPGWEKRIDLDRLNIAEPGDCILGQLYGSYLQGVHTTQIKNPNQHGFYALPGFSDDINQGWRNFVTRRLSSPAT